MQIDAFQDETRVHSVDDIKPSYPWHPYANLFPIIDGDNFDELVSDIEENGVLDPIVFYEGKVLDGRNRYLAAERLGVGYPRIEYEGNDPLGFVISHNLKRRHLTESQRAMVAAKLAKMPAHRPNKSENLPTSDMSQSQAAEMLNVSDRSIRTAKQVQDHGQCLDAIMGTHPVE